MWNELIVATGIGPFCPNNNCDTLDGPFDKDVSNPYGDVDITHTLGPWIVWGDDEEPGNIPYIEIGRGEIPSPECKSICHVQCSMDDSKNIDEAFFLTDEDRDNAKLIAAAPDLLSALENVLAVIGKMKPATGEPYGQVVAELCEARAAIAKATEI